MLTVKSKSNVMRTTTKSMKTTTKDRQFVSKQTANNNKNLRQRSALKTRGFWDHLSRHQTILCEHCRALAKLIATSYSTVSSCRCLALCHYSPKILQQPRYSGHPLPTLLCF